MQAGHCGRSHAALLAGRREAGACGRKVRWHCRLVPPPSPLDPRSGRLRPGPIPSAPHRRPFSAMSSLIPKPPYGFPSARHRTLIDEVRGQKLNRGDCVLTLHPAGISGPRYIGSTANAEPHIDDVSCKSTDDRSTPLNASSNPAGNRGLPALLPGMFGCRPTPTVLRLLIFPTSVCLHPADRLPPQVRNGENIGSIIRTAYCLGVTSIIVRACLGLPSALSRVDPGSALPGSVGCLAPVGLGGEAELHYDGCYAWASRVPHLEARAPRRRPRPPWLG